LLRFAAQGSMAMGPARFVSTATPGKNPAKAGNTGREPCQGPRRSADGCRSGL